MSSRTSPGRLPGRGVLLAACLSFGLGGCGGGVPYEHATLHGRVTIDGEAVPRGWITFSPTTGPGSVVGVEIAEGVYRCEHVPLGALRVSFEAQARELKKMMDVSVNQERLVPVDILPERYREGLEIEVTGAGEAERDFALESEG